MARGRGIKISEAFPPEEPIGADALCSHGHS